MDRRAPLESEPVSRQVPRLPKGGLVSFAIQAEQREEEILGGRAFEAVAVTALWFSHQLLRFQS